MNYGRRLLRCGSEGRIWQSEAGHCQGGKQRETLQVILRNGIAENNRFRTVWNAKHKRLKSFAQHRGVFLSVVPEPAFPQSVSSNAIVGDVGFGVCDDVLDVLSRTQFDSASKELLGG